MTLGEKIAALRTGRRMSQGDLAERLNVSRQSVSKWETGASIPDLDKLLLLSDLFQISVDELVRDGAPPAPTAEAADSGSAAPRPAPGLSTQKTVGFILLAVGLTGGLLGLFFNLVLLILSIYLLLCGVLCVAFRRPVGLLIAWTTLIPILIAMRQFTGVRLSAVFSPVYYQHAPSINLIMSFVTWALLLLLVRATVKRTPLGGHTVLVLGWVVFSQLGPSLRILFLPSSAYDPLYLIPAGGALLLLAALLFFTGKALLKWRNTKSRNRHV